MEALRKGWYLGEKSFKDKLLAMVIRERTGVGNGCISQRLAMGSPTSVCRLVSAGRKDKNRLEEMNRLLQRIYEH